MSKTYESPWIVENLVPQDMFDLQQLVNHIRCIDNCLGSLQENLLAWLEKPRRKTDRQLAYDMALETQFLMRMVVGLDGILLIPHSKRVYKKRG